MEVGAFVWISQALSLIAWVFLLWMFCHDMWDVPKMLSLFETLFTSVSTYTSSFFIVVSNMLIAYLPTLFTIMFRPYPSQVCAEIERGLTINKNQVLPAVPDDPSLNNYMGKNKRLKVKRAKSSKAKLTAKPHVVQMVMAMFKRYDTDKSNAIGQSELKSIRIENKVTSLVT